jgi:putative spermidine/putrescine transport system substrate-binding protein
MYCRKTLLAGFAATVMVTTGVGNTVFAADTEITFSGSGGVVSKITKQVYNEPFTKETGIKIKRVGTESKRMVQLEAMVRSGKIIWDAMEVSASDYPIGVKKGLFEPIDYSLVDPDNKLPAAARKKYGVGYAAWSQILAVRTDKLPAGKKMKTWADFWNVKEFPGPRALRVRPQDNLEFALLADGVAKKDLYKVLSTKKGQDRAFAKLDEIKPHIVTWWKSGAQSVQLLSDGEVHYGTSYNGRITKIAKSGVPTAIVWEGGAMHLSFVGIPKGSTHMKEAHAFARYRTLDAERMREYITHLPYPGFAPGLYDGLDPKVAMTLPTSTANIKAQFSADEVFWANNLDAIQERWTEWLLL